MTERTLSWYVAITYRKERIIKHKLEEKGIDHFIPLKEVVKERNGKRITVTELVIPGYVFIHTDLHTVLSLVKDLGLSIRIMRESGTYIPATVPDVQMQHFIFLTTFTMDKDVHFVSPKVRQGDKVRVVKGDFAGIEGELVRIHGHKRVVVRLNSALAIATTYIPLAFLEKIEEPTLG